MTTGETLNNIVDVFIAKKNHAKSCATTYAMQFVMSQLDNDRNLCVQFLKEAEIWQSAIQIVNQNRS